MIRTILHIAPQSAAALLAVCACLAARAAGTGCEENSPDCVPVGSVNVSVAVGAGTRTNPVEGKSDIPLVLFPQVSYYGKRFFLENLELGYTLSEGEKHTLNLIVTPGYDRVFFYRHDPQNVVVPLVGAENIARVSLRRRHTTVLAGPEWLFHSGRFDAQLSTLYEATGRHKGYEVRLAGAAALFEAQANLVASAGLTWKSTELVRYYYGADEFYQPGSAVNPFVKLAYTRPLTQRWTFKASAHYEHLGSDIADSPLVSDKGVSTVFLGFAYRIR